MQHVSITIASNKIEQLQFDFAVIDGLYLDAMFEQESRMLSQITAHRRQTTDKLISSVSRAHLIDNGCVVKFLERWTCSRLDGENIPIVIQPWQGFSCEMSVKFCLKRYSIT